MKEIIAQLAQSPKVGTAISTATTGAGLGAILDWIPNDVGKLATIVGIILSIILIWVHLLIVKKTQLEIADLRQAEKLRRLEKQRRIDEGLPVRRGEDINVILN